MKNKKFSPIFVFIILTFVTILLSFVLSLFNLQAEYSTVNSFSNTLQNNVIQVENLFSVTGVKYIITSTVSNFVNFEPLSMLIIILIGIGVIEKSGFARTFFTLITQNSRKYTITFALIFLSIISSVFGNIGFVLLLPIGAMMFKYGHRHPLGGIIASFAGICFGYGINIFLTSMDTSLMSLTLTAAKVIDVDYSIGIYFQLFIMIVALILASILLTRVTERTIMPKLGKYEFDEVETLDKVKFTNRELRGLVVGIGAAILYLIVVVYMIIPGLPFSGGLLDNNGVYYIDKLFGPNSLFSQGFVFIITFLFIVVGLAYGFMARTISNNKEVSECLSFSLDGIGGIIVLLFVSSLFINVFEKSNIGLIIVALLTQLVEVFSFSGFGLVVLLFIVSVICGLFYTGLKSKWEVMSGLVVPTLMNASISPEFAQFIYVAGSSLSMAFTPVMAYYVIYIAYMEKYDKNDDVTLFGSFKYMKSYGAVMFALWIILILGFYITGVPMGINSTPGLVF
jgi:aminobenzoyl-glutamate transport protein